MNRKVSATIAAILSGNAVKQVYAAPDAAAESGALAEVIVTAQRRAESTQDVPMTIQVLTADTLSQLNVQTFQDFLLYLPNVSTATNGPGQNNIYMRGLSVAGNYSQGSGGVGSFPNVAVYLDEQSAQIPGRNLDIYAADLERIEVLEGPQGTLFGSGSEAGVLRYITNKPKLDATEGKADAAYGYTSHGDPSTRVEAVLNVPLVPDKLAIRGVVYDDRRGGYINSVPGTFRRFNSDPSIHYAGDCIPSGQTCVVPPNSAVINNANYVGNAINPLEYNGMRVEALYQINDAWDALISQSYQNMNADGVFYQTPHGVDGEPLPDLSVQLFNPSYNKDWFENTSLTITGRVGALKLVYAGSYLVHNADQVTDYTNYARGVYVDYYQCIPGPTPQTGTCYTPSSTWHERENDTHQSHELRLTTPDDWRLRGIAGVFWEDYVVRETIDFLYRTAPGFAPLIPPPGSTAVNPDVRPYDDSFFDDITRGYHQTAGFASVDFDLVPKQLTLTAGTRYYKFTNSEVGSEVSTFGCYVGVTTTTPCSNYASGVNLNAEDLRSTYSGFRSRADLKWKVSNDVMLYYTWSQGFRPGGFNRSSTDHNLAGGYIFTTPISFAPDSLTNNELGWKADWLDHHLLINGSVYQEDWKDVQTEFFDPQAGLGNLTFVTNGPDYRVRGVELQSMARPIRGLTVTGAASWNSSNQTNSPYLIASKGPLAGQPIVSIPNPYGPKDSPTAQSPPFQFNLRLRYEFPIGDYNAFCQIGGQHQAHSYTATGHLEAYDLPAFTTYEASLGVSKGPWTVQLLGQNLTDTRANLFTSDYEWIVAETVNRPRTVMLDTSFKF